MKPAVILLIDDNKTDLLLAKKVLGKEKVFNMVYGFSDPDKAMQFLKTEPVDVLMVDMSLGKISGLDFLKQAKTLGHLKDKISIIISGIKDPELAARADLLGVSAWIDKPLNLQKLHYVVMHVPELFVSIMRED